MRSRIIGKLQTYTESISSYVAPFATSALATLNAPVVAQELPEPQKCSVHMTPTSRIVSSAEIEKTLNECVEGKKSHPEIFEVLLRKKSLTPTQAVTYADKLAKAGRVRELDALVSSGAIDTETATEKLVTTNRSEVFQALLEARTDLKQLRGLFDPETPVTIVEASDAEAIRKAKAVTGASQRQVIEVDTTEAYSPSHRVEVFTPKSLSPSFTAISDNSSTLFGNNSTRQFRAHEHLARLQERNSGISTRV